MSASILALSSNGNGNATTNNNGNATTTGNNNNNTNPGNANNREFVEGWTLAQTLGEGAYGE